MMSPRLPLHLLTHARRARRFRLPASAAVAACAVGIIVATAATPVASAAAPTPGETRLESRAWNPFFEQQRPVVANDARRVVVVFDDPSLGEWAAAGARALTAPQRTAWMRRARALQQRRLDALSAGGVQFSIEHRYLRVLNGASIVVHGSGAQLLGSMDGVDLVVPVRTIWPMATSAGAVDAGAAGAAAAAGAPNAEASTAGGVHVAVLDAGIEATHPGVAGHVDGAFDATRAEGRAAGGDVEADPHGTAVASAVLRGAGAAASDIHLDPVRVLAQRPTRDGIEALSGDSDDLLAGIEHAVDPDGNVATDDAADVALVASGTPFASFTDSPEDRATRGASDLGTLVVAAAGNDGASGDDAGTISSVAGSTSALAVGAVDLRGRTAAVDVRIHGGPIDETIDAAPLLTAGANRMPGGSLDVVVVDAPGADVVDYLDAELRSRVVGAVALVTARDGITIASQVRAAADAGAIAVLVAADHAGAAAGTIDVPGADIPAIGLDSSDAQALRGALADTNVAVSLASTTESNPAFGHVPGFSSSGPRLDGIGRPDVVAPGVGMLVAGAGASWHVQTGTSIAAAWAAGAAAAVSAAHPAWDAATVRAALIASATPLGSTGDRPDVQRQGAGLVDGDRASSAAWQVGSGRIDFGTIAPGATAHHDLGLLALGAAGADAPPRILLDDGGRANAVTPALSGDQLVLHVADDAAVRTVGGWLVLPELGIRVPWTATIGDAAAATVPLRASVTTDTIRPIAGPGAFASTLSLAIGGHDGDGALGIAAVQRLELRLVDAAGKDHGVVGGLDQALPGVYTFGLSGVGPDGSALKAGKWTLRVRYVPAADPSGEWRTGPDVALQVEAARHAR
jgi:hypothetical protein